MTTQTPAASPAWDRGLRHFDAAPQEAFCSHDRQSPWGARSAERAKVWAGMLLRLGELCDDDLTVDFGGNDGLVAETWKAVTNRDMTVYEPLETRIAVARARGLRCIEGVLETLPFADGEVAWGYCSHTLEHVFDLAAALRELARVVSQGLYIVVPLEGPESWGGNPAHNHGSPDPAWWLDQIERAGFVIYRHEAIQYEVDGELLLIALKPEALLRWKQLTGELTCAS